MPRKSIPKKVVKIVLPKDAEGAFGGQQGQPEVSAYIPFGADLLDCFDPDLKKSLIHLEKYHKKFSKNPNKASSSSKSSKSKPKRDPLLPDQTPELQIDQKPSILDLSLPQYNPPGPGPSKTASKSSKSKKKHSTTPIIVSVQSLKPTPEPELPEFPPSPAESNPFKDDWGDNSPEIPPDPESNVNPSDPLEISLKVPKKRQRKTPASKSSKNGSKEPKISAPKANRKRKVPEIDDGSPEEALDLSEKPKRIRSNKKYKDSTSLCPQCGKEMVSKTLAHHIRVIHEGARPHSCPVEGCSATFRYKKPIELHLIQEHPEMAETQELKEKSILCHLCGKEVFTKEQLRNHLINTHDIKGARAPCPICGKIYKSLDFINKFHIPAVHGEANEEDKKIICDWEGCGRKYLTKYHLGVHIRSVHTRKNKFTKAYKRKPKVDVEISCKICSKIMMKSKLHLHNAVFHDEESDLPHTCPQPSCPAAARTKREINNHVRVDHEDLAAQLGLLDKFACGICPKQFTYAHALKAHMLAHEDSSSSTCNICGKVFTTAAYVSLHVRDYHNAKTFLCPHEGCGKAFPSQIRLNMHWKRVPSHK